MPVERMVREYCRGLKNVFFCVFFATDRIVKQLNDPQVNYMIKEKSKIN
jgi:hypothetical protein